jgi:hypothetical protein
MAAILSGFNQIVKRPLREYNEHQVSANHPIFEGVRS